LQNNTILKINYNNIEYIIESKNKLNDNFNIDNKYIYLKKNNLNNTKLKAYIFIWFLNDYNNNYSFWKNYDIEIKKGKLLIYPVSWCFPCIEFLNSNDIKYDIYGYIYL
jgi:hypothetical protein